MADIKILEKAKTSKFQGDETFFINQNEALRQLPAEVLGAELVKMIPEVTEEKAGIMSAENKVNFDLLKEHHDTGILPGYKIDYLGKTAMEVADDLMKHIITTPSGSTRQFYIGVGNTAAFVGYWNNKDDVNTIISGGWSALEVIGVENEDDRTCAKLRLTNYNTNKTYECTLYNSVFSQWAELVSGDQIDKFLKNCVMDVSATNADITFTKGDGTESTITVNNVANAASAANATAATKATQDSTGQQINTTYIKGLSVSGKTITYTKGNGSTGTITTQDTVYTHPNSGVTAGTYRSVTVNAQGHITGGSKPTTLAGYGITDAPTKIGTGASGTWGINVTGNAATATKATQDSAGQQINTTYIKGLSVSGATLTITKGNGTTSTATINQTAGMLPATKVLQGGGTKLYSYKGGLDVGNITLSQAFTNFKYLVIFLSQDNMAEDLYVVTVETAALYQAMAGNNTYWPGNKGASVGERVLLSRAPHNWGIFNIKGGSSTTYFKHYADDSARLYSIYGIN